MRQKSSFKPDHLTILIIFVIIGLLLTTIVEADDVHHARAIEFEQGSVANPTSSYNDKFYTEVNWTLVPDSGGMRVLYNDGMIYMQFDNRYASQGKKVHSTKLTFGLGMEENIFYQLPATYRNSTATPEWYKTYVPKAYLSVGYSWK